LIKGVPRNNREEKMEISKSSMDGVFEIRTQPVYIDQRGTLFRVFDDRLFKEQGFDIRWNQQTYQLTKPRNVLRGLYVQLPPFTEAKLVNLLSGNIYWVVVDVRKGSSYFGKWHAVKLEMEGINGLLVEGGFAHGCLSLTDDCSLIISADNYYSHEHGLGIVWDDLELGIDWPISNEEELIISDEHKAYPSFAEFKRRYEGV